MQTSSLTVPVKLWAFFCAMLGISLAVDFTGPCILTLLAFISLACQRKWRLLFSFGIFYLFILTLLCLVRFYSIHLIVFSEFYLMLFYHLMPVFVIGWDLITTPPGKLSAALSKAHAPTAIILGLLVIFRFFPTIKTELKEVVQSMKNRQLVGIKEIIFHPLTTIEYVLVPLLLRCLQIADQLAVSAVTRGAEAPGKRSSYYTDKPGTLDYLWLVLWTLATTFVLITRNVV